MKGTRLSDSWKPNNGDRDYGHALFLTDAQINDMAEDMRLWAGANANRQVARKADWSLTFKGWMRREAKRGYGNGQGRPSALQDDSKSISRAAERLAQAAERGEFSFGPRPTGRPAESETNFRLLPKG